MAGDFARRDLGLGADEIDALARDGIVRLAD